MTLRSRGFTLLELLIAVAVFAIVGVLAYSGLDNVLNMSARTQQHGEELKKLQLAMRVLERDMSQLIDRPIRDQYGDTQPALTGDAGRLTFTHAGWRNPAGLKRASLQRVDYALDDGAFIRTALTKLDGANVEEDAILVRLLENVDQVELCFRATAKDRCQTSWPPLTRDEAPPALPSLVEITLDVQPWGQIHRVFAKP